MPQTGLSYGGQRPIRPQQLSCRGNDRSHGHRQPAGDDEFVKILAVDTSGFEGSVALSEDRILVEQRLLTAEGRRHAQTLVSEVDRLLRDQRLRPKDIDAVAVSTKYATAPARPAAP